MAKNPRMPVNVWKLIRDAETRQATDQATRQSARAEAEHLSWLRRVLASDRAARAERRSGRGRRRGDNP